MVILLLTALPCVGMVLILVLAFVGENESRKNYFRAIIAWFLIIVGLAFLLALLGAWPAIQNEIQGWIHSTQHTR
jgi:hypothetical protein